MERGIYMKSNMLYPPEMVWRALTEADLLGQWFVQNDMVPTLGKQFTFKMAPQKGWNGITHRSILEVVSLKHVAYTYRGEATGEKALACAGIHSAVADDAGKGIFTQLDTELCFTIEPTCGGSLLTMQHRGFKGFKLVLVSFIMEMGWKKQLLKKLPALLEKLKQEKPLK